MSSPTLRRKEQSMQALMKAAVAGECVHCFYDTTAEASAAFYANADRAIEQHDAAAFRPHWTLSFPSGGRITFDTVYAHVSRIEGVRIDQAVGHRGIRSALTRAAVERKLAL